MMNIGFIGQGYVGKNYADDFEKRGYPVVRYALEKPYIENKDLIKTCDVVFVAVPTPTTPKGFDGSLVDKVLPLVNQGSIVVIKSTLAPGYSEALQKRFPKLTILFSPEFLSEVSAAYDAAHPFANIIGLTKNSQKHRAAAKKVHSILASAPYATTCSSTEAELIKYAHNGNGFVQVVFFNLMYDLAKQMGARWENIQDAITHDPYISKAYSRPLHKSGRGAGGHCFIKDFATLRLAYEKQNKRDSKGIKVLKDLESKNNELLAKSRKDTDLLKGVHGKKALKK